MRLQINCPRRMYDYTHCQMWQHPSMSRPHSKWHRYFFFIPSVAVPPFNAYLNLQQQRPISPGATLTKIIVPGQNGATIHFINKTGVTESLVTTSSGTAPTSHPIVIRTSSSSTPGSSNAHTTSPSPIQLRNVIHNPQSPITIVSKPGQIIKLVRSESVSTVSFHQCWDSTSSHRFCTTASRNF